LIEKTSPFDTFVQIIEGKAEIVIDKLPHLLQSGEGIIVPAHESNFIKPNGRFKMISTVIKSGYE
jgi:quercetin dioxygenase-like cupin family protein